MKTTLHNKTLDTIEFPPILYKYRNWNDEYNKRFITEKEVFNRDILGKHITSEDKFNIIEQIKKNIGETPIIEYNHIS